MSQDEADADLLAEALVKIGEEKDMKPAKYAAAFARNVVTAYREKWRK